MPAQHQIFEMRHCSVSVLQVVVTAGSNGTATIRSERDNQAARDKRKEGSSSVVGPQRFRDTVKQTGDSSDSSRRSRHQRREHKI